MTDETSRGLWVLHEQVQNLTSERRRAAQHRTEFAKQAKSEGASIPDLQALLGLSRTGVVKILAGSAEDRAREDGALA